MSFIDRRNFLKTTTAATTAIGLGLGANVLAKPSRDFLFKISLAEWSLNKLLFGGKMNHLDFAPEARKHGIEAIEYVNQFFKDKAQDKAYLKDMKLRADQEGVKSLLIMCDREGQLGDIDPKKRLQTVENHKKWVEAAKFLECHSIRVNGYSMPYSDSKADFKESQKLVADGLQKLCEFAQDFGLNVIIENHGGFSSNASWLAGVIKMTGQSNAGTLPDTGNFKIQSEGDGKKLVSYDTYKGLKKLMPYAKGVSIKTTAWDSKGNESPLDYEKMTRLVLDTGFEGYFGIEHATAENQWKEIEVVRQKLIETRDKLQDTYME